MFASPTDMSNFVTKRLAVTRKTEQTATLIHAVTKMTDLTKLTKFVNLEKSDDSDEISPRLTKLYE